MSTPGEHDAITDVAGVKVGSVTLIEGERTERARAPRVKAVDRPARATRSRRACHCAERTARRSWRRRAPAVRVDGDRVTRHGAQRRLPWRDDLCRPLGGSSAPTTPEALRALRRAVALAARVLAASARPSRPAAPPVKLEPRRRGDRAAASGGAGRPTRSRRDCVSVGDEVCHGIPGRRLAAATWSSSTSRSSSTATSATPRAPSRSRPCAAADERLLRCHPRRRGRAACAPRGRRHGQRRRRDDRARSPRRAAFSVRALADRPRIAAACTSGRRCPTATIPRSANAHEGARGHIEPMITTGTPARARDARRLDGARRPRRAGRARGAHDRGDRGRADRPRRPPRDRAPATSTSCSTAETTARRDPRVRGPTRGLRAAAAAAARGRRRSTARVPRSAARSRRSTALAARFGRGRHAAARRGRRASRRARDRSAGTDAPTMPTGRRWPRARRSSPREQRAAEHRAGDDADEDRRDVARSPSHRRRRAARPRRPAWSSAHGDERVTRLEVRVG